MRTRRYLAKLTTEPTRVTESVTVDLGRPADEVFAVMWDPASPLGDPTFETGFTLPGTPSQAVGEVQVQVRRDAEGRRVVQALEVVELEHGRRAVTRTVTSGGAGGGTLTVDPLSPSSCRLTQEVHVDLPALVLAALVAETRASVQAFLDRLAEALRAEFGPA